MIDTNIVITIILGSISIFTTIFAVYYSHKTYWTSRSPKIVIETLFNSSLEIRNIGTDIAKNLKEKSGLLKDLPAELWNFVGPIDYLRVKNSGISKTMNFQDGKIPQSSTSVLIRFEYENTDGDKFYSEIIIKRGKPTQQVWFDASQLKKWGRF